MAASITPIVHTVLPDELIKDILSPLLTIPDHLFRDTCLLSPFATPSQSSSLLLGVCKQWMRVATPILYHVVVLRSRAQAQALEYALRRNPELGRHVRKLRLEGGFGSSMHKILLLSPNITDLCLSMDLWSSDGVSGLVKGLPLMNPVHVVLREGRDKTRDNGSVRSLVRALCETIERWTTLETFDFPYDRHRGHDPHGLEIARALSKSRSLKTILISPLIGSIENIKLFAQSSNIRHIRAKPVPRQADALADLLDDRDMSPEENECSLLEMLEGGSAWFLTISAEKEAIEADDRLRSLVVFDDINSEDLQPKLPPSSNPFYIPMQDAPEDAREEIWSRIIDFAAGGKEAPPVLRQGWFVYDNAQWSMLELCRTRFKIAMVSKQFWRLAEPYLYRDPILMHYDEIIDFAFLLSRHPNLASHIRTIAFMTRDLDNSSRFLGTDLAEYLQRMEAFEALCTIFSMAYNLVSVRQLKFDPLEDECREPNQRCRLSWDVFSYFMIDTTLNNIQELLGLWILQPETPEGFLLLSRFVKLKELRINVRLQDRLLQDVDKDEPKDRLPEITFPPSSLAKLETLVYAESYEEKEVGAPWGDDEESSKNPSLLGALSAMALPSIRTLTVDSTLSDHKSYKQFLKKHGSKLEELVLGDNHRNLVPFAYCRHLKRFTLSWPEPHLIGPQYFYCDPPLKTLEKISITGDDEYFKETAKEWDKFFKNVDFSHFPSLQELHIPSCKWPTTEREVLDGKNPWVARSDLLLHRCNVRLTDANGKHWIPRLGMKSRSRRVITRSAGN